MNKLIGLYLLILSFSASSIDLSPINNQDWTHENVRHLLSRSGFGATPDKIETLLKSSPSKVVQEIVYFKQKKKKEFIESGIFDPSLDPFPPSRPYLTKYAKLNGGALGVKNKFPKQTPTPRARYIFLLERYNSSSSVLIYTKSWRNHRSKSSIVPNNGSIDV